VDGAVEAATHTIVTDAIESLLFDEEHTRETYRKHEKELSISTLPGVIPISKQLFASEPARVCNGSNAAISEAKSLQKQPSNQTETVSTFNDLEGVPRRGETSTARVPRKVTEVKEISDSSPPSPTRMEAAAALVSQARQGKEDIVRFAPRGR
jgi:hypothetical protein